MTRADDSHDPRLRRFDAALRRWAARPVPQPPAAWRPEGAQGPERPSLAADASRSRRRAPWRLAAAGVAAAALAASLLLLRSTAPATRQAPAAAWPEPSPLAAVASPDEVLVLWLDPETPLYLTLAPAAEAPGAERRP